MARSRNVVFDRGRGWPDETGRFDPLRSGANLGEYGPRETSEYSDAYYGPGDDYPRREFHSGGYSREQEPIAPSGVRPGRPVGRFAAQRHPDNRVYGSVQSFGELHEGDASWADLKSHRESSPTSHRGRGPKGYARSDERVNEAICERLTDDAHIDATNIDVEVRQGEVTLTGSVTSRDEKWRVEDVVESIGGVQSLNNRLRVQR